MKKRMSGILFFICGALSALQLGAVTHYQTVSTYLPQGKTISRLSQQSAINDACNVAQAYLTNALRRAKNDQEKKDLAQKDAAIKSACAVLRSSEKRTAYHQQLDAGSIKRLIEIAY